MNYLPGWLCRPGYLYSSTLCAVGIAQCWEREVGGGLSVFKGQVSRVTWPQSPALSLTDPVTRLPPPSFGLFLSLGVAWDISPG